MRDLVRFTLRQRRYVRVLTAMALVAVGCLAAGSFEAHRYIEKRQDNRSLVAAAHASPVALTRSLVAVTDGSRLPDTSDVRLRRVTVTGRYLGSAQTYVGNVTQGGRQGFYVLTPLRSASGVLLVARGFVAAVDGSQARPSEIAAPPTGSVTVTGRLAPGQRTSDQFGVLGRGEIASINPVQQSARLGSPVFAAWLSLASSAPGASGLDAMPGPDLSNPSGGARQWQLLSYVVQWYAFALLAVLAPFLFARAELKDARRRFLGVDDDAEQLDAPETDVLELDGASSSDGGAALQRRRGGELTRTDPASPRYRQAARLADRYGRALSTTDRGELTQQDADVPVRRRRMPDADRATFSPQVAADSRATPHRSVDAYQGSYNDYLWQLALSDGQAPETAPETGPKIAPQPERDTEGANPPPRVIDVEPEDR